MTEVVDEPPVEDKPQEALQFLDGYGLWPILYCLYLPLVHVNDVSVDDIAKELNSVTVELTILELEVQMVFPKFLEDLHHMVVMFGLVLETGNLCSHLTSF